MENRIGPSVVIRLRSNNDHTLADAEGIMHSAGGRVGADAGS